MADDFSLPRLKWDPTTESFSQNAVRKRARLSSPPASSDPALFSSDDDPSADNYTQERRKKKYRGPWFQQRPASEAGSQDTQDNVPEKKTKRTFERQFDSGVFMGSDGTDFDDVLEELETKNAPTLPLPLRHSRGTAKLLPTPEELVKGQIQRCLEEGNESVDLSSRGLTSLSNATIRPLATFTRVPPVIEGVYTRLEPKLKVFLASNDLTSLPGEIFKLDRLTVLSLRGNQFEELPPGIGKLASLKELNLSQNSLRCLPFEILELFSDASRLNSLNLHPNPFYQPGFSPNTEIDDREELQYKIGIGNRGRARPRRGAVCCISPEQRRRSWHSQWNVTYQARSEVRYLDINGNLLKGPSFSDDSVPVPVADSNDVPQPPTSRGGNISRAPSLLEVALLACSRTTQLPSLSSFLPDDRPAILVDLLAYATTKKDSGGTQCTVCGRNFIIPRTEWIEWWEIAKVLDRNVMASAASPLRQMENERDVLESMVPLMRRGCSWLCVPEQVIVLETDATATEE